MSCSPSSARNVHTGSSMRYTCVEDLPVYRRAEAFFKAIVEVTLTFRSDYWLADQLNNSAESTLSNIAEGYRQTTDRAFARYLTISASSAEESRTHLLAAEMMGHVEAQPSLELRREAKEIADMLGGFIRYLHRCDRKDRLRIDERPESGQDRQSTHSGNRRTATIDAHRQSTNSDNRRTTANRRTTG